MIVTSEFRAKDIERARRSNPASLLTNFYGAKLKEGCYKHHLSSQYVLADGRVVTITFKKETGRYIWVINHDRSQGGCGCIDLAVALDGCSVQAAIFKLCPSLDPTRAWNGHQSRVAPTTPDACADEDIGELESVKASPPLASMKRWPHVREWFTRTRGLPGRLVDELHLQGLIYADERANAVFRRVHGGAFLRGTTPAPFFRAIGSKVCGPFVVDGDRHVVLVESPVDALSVKSMDPQCCAIALGGAMLSAQDVLAEIPSGRPIILAFDNDERGAEFTASSLLVLPGAKVRTPDAKDWNDAIRAAPSKIHRDWA